MLGVAKKYIFPPQFKKMLSDTQLNPAGKVLLGCCDDTWWFSGPVGWFLPHGSKIIQPSVELRPVGLVVGEGVLGLARLHFKTLRATHLLLEWLHSRLRPFLLLPSW